MTDNAGVRVLVADDDGPFCDMMKAVLRMAPYVGEVRTVQRGLLALGACVDFSPDVVFIDSMMPAMDGGVVGSNVRKLLPDARLVSISGNPAKQHPSWADLHVLKNGDLFARLQSVVLGA